MELALLLVFLIIVVALFATDESPLVNQREDADVKDSGASGSEPSPDFESDDDESWIIGGSVFGTSAFRFHGENDPGFSLEPDYLDDRSPSVNPASGLPMMGSVDIEGNPYGVGSMSDIHTDCDMDSGVGDSLSNDLTSGIGDGLGDDLSSGIGGGLSDDLSSGIDSFLDDPFDDPFRA